MLTIEQINYWNKVLKSLVLKASVEECVLSDPACAEKFWDAAFLMSELIKLNDQECIPQMECLECLLPSENPSSVTGVPDSNECLIKVSLSFREVVLNDCNLKISLN